MKLIYLAFIFALSSFLAFMVFTITPMSACLCRDELAVEIARSVREEPDAWSGNKHVGGSYSHKKYGVVMAFNSAASLDHELYGVIEFDTACAWKMTQAIKRLDKWNRQNIIQHMKEDRQ